MKWGPREIGALASLALFPCGGLAAADNPASLATDYAAVAKAFAQETDDEKRMVLADRMIAFQEERFRAESRDPRRARVAALCRALIEHDRPDWDEIRQKRAAASDDQERRAFSFQIGWTEFEVAEMTRLYEAWLGEPDPRRRKALEPALVAAAVESWHHPEIVREVAAGGRFAQSEIVLPARSSTVRLAPLHAFDSPLNSNGAMPRWVIRRMTARNFELWSPTHGWLFDASGKIVNEARPPRRDGQGRDWYGAFLPDGRWVTTDIWEQDNTLHFFSARGKWIAERQALGLIAAPVDRADGVPLIGWCRCDRSGKEWVISVGSDQGLGMAAVSPGGASRPVSDPWRLCYPRDLEPKGMYNLLGVPDDAGEMRLQRSEAGHGMWVGFPGYSTPRWKESLHVPGGRMFGYEASYSGFHTPTFGFWPGARDVFIVADFAQEGAADRPITWFYGGDGNFAGWIAATRLADAEDGKAMLFDLGKGSVATLARDLRVRAVRRFVWPEGDYAEPDKIFPDLRLGFFWLRKDRPGSEVPERKLVLARW